MGVAKMKLLLLTFTLAITVASAELSEETLLMDVTDSIAAMKKKGATAADCKDLAKTTCKEVVSERKTDQKMINKLRTGRHCVNKGQPGVTKAQVHYKKMKKVLTKAQIEVTNASNLKVTIASQRFKSLKVGRCGFIFGSRSYLSAKAKYTRAQRIVVKYKGIVSEAWKAVVTMKKTAARLVKNCHCRTKKAYYKVWKVVTSKKRISRQAKAYAKCKMMACVLNGTNISSAKCKGTLKAITHKKLFHATSQVSGCTVTSKKPAVTKTRCGNVANGGAFKNVVLGCAGQSCIQACSMIKKRCDSSWEAYISKQRNVAAFMRSMAKSFGRQCKHVQLNHKHQNSPYTHPKTGYAKGTWCSAGNGKGFSCSARHPADRRYCRCK